MAITRYGVNDELAVKLWSKMMAVEALKATPIRPLIGKSSGHIIRLMRELKKSGGDKVTYALRMQLVGDGVTETEAMEGNEESLSTYSDALYINELLNAVKAANKGRSIDTQRVLFNCRTEAKSGLRDWFAKRYSVAFFNQVAGNVRATDTKYTGLNSVIAPSSTRHIWAGTATSDESLTSSDIFDLKYIDYLKEKAITADPQIRPVSVLGEGKYVIYLHPYQITDLRTNTSTGQWQDIQKAAMQGGKVSKNPIYTGALGEYNNVIIRMSHDVPTGTSSADGSEVATVRRAVFLGAQAMTYAVGRDNGPTDYSWVEETFDYKRQLGVSVMSIHGFKKCQFNSKDFGSIVLSTYAAAHA
jgi:N4-gp56 family major capsid protein